MLSLANSKQHIFIRNGDYQRSLSPSANTLRTWNMDLGEPEKKKKWQESEDERWARLDD